MSVLPLTVKCDNCGETEFNPHWFIIERKKSSTKIIIQELNSSIPRSEDLHACNALCLGEVIKKLARGDYDIK